MANISKLRIGSTDYDIKDSTARSGVSTNATAISEIQDDYISYSNTIGDGNINDFVPTDKSVSLSLYTTNGKEALFSINAATTEKAGILTAADKTKIDKIDTITSDIAGGMHFIGTTKTALTDGATTSTLEATSTNSLTKSSKFIAGDMVVCTTDGTIANKKEFVWTGSAWALFGDLSSLGSLAYKSSASGKLPAGNHNHSFTGTAHSHTATVSGGSASCSYTPAGTISIKDSHATNGSFMYVHYNPTSATGIAPMHVAAQEQFGTTTLRGVSGTASITPFGSAGSLPSGNTVLTDVTSTSTSVSVSNETLTIPASVLTGISTTTGNALSSRGTLPTAGTAVVVATANSSSTTVATYTAHTTDTHDTTNYKWIELPSALSASFTGTNANLDIKHTNPTITINKTTATGTINATGVYSNNATITVS